MHFIISYWHQRLLFVMVAVFMALPVLAEIAPAGTFITNRAEVSYFDTEDGLVKKAYSNISEIEVASVYALDLQRDSDKKVTAGQKVILSHRLTNIGNASTAYELRLIDIKTQLSSKFSVSTEDSGSLGNIKITIDSNSNGIADNGESVLPVTACRTEGAGVDTAFESVATSVSCFSVPVLNLGEIIEFVIEGDVPVDASVGNEYGYRLVASAIEDRNQTDANDDILRVVDGAVMSINKGVLPACGTAVYAKDEVKYKITFTNTGNAAPASRLFSIDGSNKEGVLLEDLIPNNLNLKKNAAPDFKPIQGQAVVQLKSVEGTNEWISYANWNGTDLLSHVGLYIPSTQVQPNQTGFLEFTTIASTRLTDSTIYNEAGFNTEAGSAYEFVSNEVCTTLKSGSAFKGTGGSIDEGAEIRFLSPTLAIKISAVAPDFTQDDNFVDTPYYRLENGFGSGTYDQTRDGVYIEVVSSALNEDQDVIEQGIVTLTTDSGDTLKVVVVETGPNTGKFRSIRVIRLSTVDKGEGQTCPVTTNLSADYDAVEDACVLQSTPDGEIRAKITIVDEILADAALIDPLGVVFDSAYNYPVAGAVVSIHNADDGKLATDPLTGDAYPEQTTSSDGKYQFPYLYTQDQIHSGQYYIEVSPPAGYTFPSSIPAITFVGNTGRNVNEYSYGRDGQDGVVNSGQFTLLASSADLIADIPLDPSTEGLLVIEKSTATSKVSIGGFLTYSIKVQNFSDKRNPNMMDTNLYNVKVYDTLPYGFRYVSGTAFFDDKKIADPVGAPGPNVMFSVWSTQSNNSLDNKPHTLTYRVRVSAGALDSDGVNTAYATSRTNTSLQIRSNTSKFTVRISEDGVLDSRGIVFGKVYVDADCDGIQNGGEWPIGGVKLYLENGTWVITDGNGQYSLYGLDPGMHVIKLDPITLPHGVKLKPLDNRHMGDAGSRLVDITKGDFHRADFATSCPKGDVEYVYEQIQARNAGTNDFMLANAEKYDPTKEVAQRNDAKAAGADGDLSNGTVSFDNSLDKKSKSRFGPTINRGYSYMIARYRSKDRAESAIGKLPASVRKEAFIYETGDFHTVRIGFSLNDKDEDLYNLGQSLKKLKIDSVLVATIYERLPAHVLDRLESPGAVELMTTPQELIKTVSRQQGKAGTWLWPKTDTSLDGRFMVAVRASVSPTLIVNGKAVSASQIGERIENKREKTQVVAWYGVELNPGENTLEVVAKDPFGNQRTLASKVFKRPEAAVKMTMTAVSKILPADGGRTYLPVTIKLLDKNNYPARGTHFVTISATEGRWVERDIQDQTTGHQIRIVNGERTLHLRSSEYTGDIVLTAEDGELKAEEKITQVVALRPIIAVGLIDIGAHNSRLDNILSAPESQRELSGIRGRAAFFMKGKVFDDSHLTLAYDSEKEVKGQRFRDINPHTGYPMYGDASQRGFEAQSRSKVYAKLERKKDSVMWGDYLTDASSNYDTVDRNQRSLTGVNAIKDDGTTRVQAYYSRPEDNHFSEEIRGKGTALNYRIDKHPIIRNSEVVEVVTYSRDNSGLILEVRKLSRFGDYTLDEETGDLSFADVIPYQDINNNAVYIRVSYDVEGDGEAYNVGGVRVNTQLTESLNVGASYSKDEHTVEGKEITGISGEYKVEDLKITASGAVMTHVDSTKGKGKAIRLNVEKRWNKDATTRLSAGKANSYFENQSGGIAADREEVRVNHRQRVTKEISLNVEGVHSRKPSDDSTQQSLGVTADVKVGDWTLKGGARHIRQKNSADNDQFNTVIVGAKRGIDIAGRKGSISTEYEQDLGLKSRRRISLGGDIEVHDKVKVYGRAERISSLSGVSGLSESEERDTVAIGVKSDLFKSTEVYSEYRLRGAIANRDMETASGIRGTYQVEKGLSVSPRLEVVNSIKGSGKSSIAASVGFKDTRDKNSKKTARIEARHDSDRDYIGVEASYVSRLDEEWSVLARDSARIDIPDSGDKKYNNIFTIGLSHRARKDNKHNMLFLYQNKVDIGAGVAGDCSSHILSTHQSYEIDGSRTLSGRLGGKYEKCSIGGTDSTSNAVVLDGRYLWDINNRWDVDVHGGVLATNSFAEKQYAIGAGVSYLVRENLRLSVGYNVKGFEDDDLDAEGYNKEGVFFGLQYKFDENSFLGLFDRKRWNKKQEEENKKVELNSKPLEQDQDQDIVSDILD